MKNKILNIKSIVAIFSVFALMVSCDALLDQDETDFGKGPILAQFEKSSETANFITDGTTAIYDVPIAIIGGDNQPIDKPVEITISVDPSSTATSGVEYTLEKTSYTIAPGDMSVNAQISVDTDNLDPFDVKTVVLRIDSSSQSVSESNMTTIALQAVCELDLEGFVGTYDSTGSEGPATVTIVLGSKPNSLLITGVEGGDDQILAVISGDVTKPTITFVEGGEEAVLFVHPSYGNAWATTLTPQQSSYNSCDFTINIEYKTCVGAGCFAGTTKAKLVKKN